MPPQPTPGRIFTSRKCGECSSRLRHEDDLVVDKKHMGYCGRGHRVVLGELTLPTALDFACPCGGAFVTERSVRMDYDTHVVAQETLVCPACATLWSILGVEGDPHLQAACREAARIQARLDADPRAKQAFENLRKFNGDRTSNFGRLFSNLFGFPGKEPRRPPPGNPDLQTFLAWAKTVRADLRVS